MISKPVALLVLLAALMHAGWNYLIKVSDDRLVDMVGVALGASLIAACLLPFVPFPERAAWPWLAITLLVHVGYFVGIVETYRHGDLSIAYPLMRGLAPVLVALAAPLLGEHLTPSLGLGIALVGSGIMLPAWLARRHGTLRRSSIGYAVMSSAIIACYTLSDGMGVRRAGSAVGYTLWLFFLNAWGFFALAWWRRRGRFIDGLRQRWRASLSGGALSIGAYGIALWAMTVASIPAVAALRETSVIFAALLGTWILKEHMGRVRLVGAALVALGAIAVRLA
jgi:drug/metabolite transporter (DMT)-like permease